jgi:hypothetical protein
MIISKVFLIWVEVVVKEEMLGGDVYFFELLAGVTLYNAFIGWGLAFKSCTFQHHLMIS